MPTQRWRALSLRFCASSSVLAAAPSFIASRQRRTYHSWYFFGYADHVAPMMSSSILSIGCPIAASVSMRAFVDLYGSKCARRARCTAGSSGKQLRGTPFASGQKMQSAGHGYGPVKTATGATPEIVRVGFMRKRSNNSRSNGMTPCAVSSLYAATIFVCATELPSASCTCLTMSALSCVGVNFSAARTASKKVKSCEVSITPHTILTADALPVKVCIGRKQRPLPRRQNLIFPRRAYHWAGHSARTRSLDTVSFFLFAIILLAAFTESVSGFGSALVAMAYLPLLIGIQPAVPLVALVSLALEVILLLYYRQAIKLQAIRRVILGSLLGIPLGIFFLRGVDEKIVLGLLGIVLVSYAAFSLLKL